MIDPDDLGGLRTLLWLFRWMPGSGIALILRPCNQSHLFPGFLGAGLRMLEIGIKGVTLSLYYANLTAPGYTGKKVHDVIGWHPKRPVNGAGNPREPQPPLP